MTLNRLGSLRLRLQDLRDTVEALRTLPTNVSDEVERSLARYLTVRSAGYVEAVRDDAADMYIVSSRASDEVIRRIRTNLRTGMGVRPEQMLVFMGSFHAGWRSELSDLLDEEDQKLKASLGSLVAARKKIAHGDGEAVTSGKAFRWAETAEYLGEWLIDRFDPDLPAGQPVLRLTR